MTKKYFFSKFKKAKNVIVKNILKSKPCNQYVYFKVNVKTLFLRYKPKCNKVIPILTDQESDKLKSHQMWTYLA